MAKKKEPKEEEKDSSDEAKAPEISDAPEIHDASAAKEEEKPAEESKPAAEEKASEPAKEEPKKEEPKAEEKPAEGAPAVAAADGGEEKKGPPTNIIIGAVGGVVGLILLILIIGSITGGGHPYSSVSASPELDADEDVKIAAQSYINFLEEKAWSGTKVKIDRDEEDFGLEDGKEDFYKDTSKYEKSLKQEQNKFEFFGDKDDDLEKFEIQDEKTEDKDGRKIYTCTVKGKKMIPDGDEKWKLEDREDKYALVFVKINDEWRLINKKGGPSRRVARK